MRHSARTPLFSIFGLKSSKIPHRPVRYDILCIARQNANLRNNVSVQLLGKFFQSARTKVRIGPPNSTLQRSKDSSQTNNIVESAEHRTFTTLRRLILTTPAKVSTPTAQPSTPQGPITNTISGGISYGPIIQVGSVHMPFPDWPANEENEPEI